MSATFSIQLETVNGKRVLTFGTVKLNEKDEFYLYLDEDGNKEILAQFTTTETAVKFHEIMKILLNELRN